LESHTADELLDPTFRRLCRVTQLDVQGLEWIGLDRRPLPAVNDRFQITREPGPFGLEAKSLLARCREVSVKKQWGMIRGAGGQSVEHVIWVQIAPAHASKGTIVLGECGVLLINTPREQPAIEVQLGELY
jgi:hypothetical protein